MGLVLPAEVPDDVQAALRAAGYTWERVSREALQHFAALLYGRKALSLGQAARLAGMSLWDFIPFLGEHGIPVADYDEEETVVELETARWLSSPQKTESP